MKKDQVAHTVRNRESSKTLGFGRVTSTALGSQNGSVLWGLTGLGYDDDASDTYSEGKPDQAVYAASGIYSRPPTVPEGKGDIAEVVMVRVGDETIPVGVRDPRDLKWVNKGADFTVPRAKERIYCGHGGSFISFLRRETANGPEDDFMLRLPYDRSDSGAPTKSDVVTVGRGGDGVRTIDIRSGDGAAVTIRAGKITVTAPNGKNSWELSNNGTKLLGTLTAYGGVNLGGDAPEPLAKFAAIATALGQIAAALNGIAGACTAPPLSPIGTALQPLMQTLNSTILNLPTVGPTNLVKGQ